MRHLQGTAECLIQLLLPPEEDQKKGFTVTASAPPKHTCQTSVASERLKEITSIPPRARGKSQNRIRFCELHSFPCSDCD